MTFWGRSHRSVSSPRGRSAGSSAEVPTAAPGSRSQEPETVAYLEGLASSLGGSFDEGLDSGTSSSPDCDTPDDTSDSSSVVSWGGKAGGQDHPSVPALGSHPNLQTRVEPLGPSGDLVGTLGLPDQPPGRGRGLFREKTEGVPIDRQFQVNHQWGQAAKYSRVTEGRGVRHAVRGKDGTGPGPCLAHTRLSSMTQPWHRSLGDRGEQAGRGAQARAGSHLAGRREDSGTSGVFTRQRAITGQERQAFCETSKGK